MNQFTLWPRKIDMTRKKNNSKQKAAAKAVKKPAAPQAQEPRRNIFRIESELFAKKYTNERIYKQIDNDSCLFFTILGMLIFAAAIITASFVNAYKDVRAEASFGNWLNSVRTDHPLGLVFGITIIIVACVGIGELGTLNMIKHIFPSCSGRRYSAKEINELANDPETRWINEAGVYATSKALIGFNKGLAVAEYKDIAAVSIKGKHHSKNMSYTPARGRVGPARALFYAFTDHYREWDTYYIIIRTRNHRRFVLTETAYKDSYESLKPILDERCGKVEYKIKGQ